MKLQYKRLFRVAVLMVAVVVTALSLSACSFGKPALINDVKSVTFDGVNGGSDEEMIPDKKSQQALLYDVLKVSAKAEGINLNEAQLKALATQDTSKAQQLFKNTNAKTMRKITDIVDDSNLKLEFEPDTIHNGDTVTAHISMDGYKYADKFNLKVTKKFKVNGLE